MGKSEREYAQTYHSSSVYRYFWKPAGVTFGGGLLGIMLLVGQFWLGKLANMQGIELGFLLPVLRVTAVLVGIFMLIIAAPVYRPTDWTPDEETRDRRDPDFYRSKPTM